MSRLCVRISKCSRESLSLNGPRITQYTLRSVGRGTGPEMVASAALRGLHDGGGALVDQLVVVGLEPDPDLVLLHLAHALADEKENPAASGSETAGSGSCCYSVMLSTTPAPTVRPPSRMAKRRPSSMAIGWISSTVHGGVVARHDHLDALLEGDDAGDVGGAEVELRAVALEERRVTPALVLGEHVHLGRELGVRGDRLGRGEHLAALDVLALDAAEEAADVVAGAALVEQLAEHLDAGDHGAARSRAVMPTISTVSPTLMIAALDRGRSRRCRGR